MDNGYSDAHDSGEIADPPFCNISFFSLKNHGRSKAQEQMGGNFCHGNLQDTGRKGALHEQQYQLDLIENRCPKIP